MTYKLLDLSKDSQLHLQRIADRFADVHARLAEAEGEKETVKDDLWPLFNSLGGIDAYLIYESLEPHLGQRLIRQISHRREPDVAGLKTVLSAAAFREITKTVIDTDALKLSLKLGRVDPALVKRYTTLVPVIKGPLWVAAGQKSKVHLQPGQLAVMLDDDDE